MSFKVSTKLRELKFGTSKKINQEAVKTTGINIALKFSTYLTPIGRIRFSIADRLDEELEWENLK